MSDFELPTVTMIEDLGEYEPIEWFWQGYVAPTRKTMFVGHPKAGKTTLISHLVLGFSGAPSKVGPECKPVKTLIVSEEHPDHWRRRRQLLGIKDSMIGIMPITKRYADHKEWRTFILELTKYCLERNYKCVLIDTLSSLWPVEDENCAVSAGRGLEALNAISEAGIALLCVHHAPKGKSQIGLSGRGSTAITAFFDVIVDMKRHGKGVHNTRRKLTAHSRDLETPETLVLQYEGTEGYLHLKTSLGGDEDYDKKMELEADAILLNKILPMEAPGVTILEVRESMRVGHSTAVKVLNFAEEEGTIRSTGRGVRGDPKRWYQNNREVEKPASVSYLLESPPK